MPATLRFGMILEGRAVVQNPPIIYEVHIARLQRELHAQSGIIQHLIEHIERPRVAVI